MKTLLISIMIALAAQQCREEHGNEYDVVRTEDEKGYVAEDMIRREAAAEWDKFSAGSHKRLDKAEKDVTAATDLLDSRETRNRLILEAEIIKAEGILEHLCEKLERGSRFDDIDLTDENIAKMRHFMADYLEQEKRLNSVLANLKSTKFKQQENKKN